MTDLASSIDVLTAEIAELERQLRIKKNALKELRKLGESPVDRSRSPYYDRSPKEATRMLLQSVGAPMRREDIQDALVAGGITIGRKRAEHNVRIGLDLNIENGNLVLIDELLGLPEWVEGGTFRRAPKWRSHELGRPRVSSR